MKQNLSHRSTKAWSVCLATVLTLLALLAQAPGAAFAAGTYTVVRPADTTTDPVANPNKWGPANVRTNATVGITADNGRGDAPNNLGSLKFTTNTLVNGQDKADYVQYWGVVAGRTLGNLNTGALSYEFYRASTSTTGQHLVPALRLAYLTSSGKSGYLIWENVYNGGSTSTPVPTDQWLSKDILAGNFWMREFSPGATIQNYGVTLAEWQANNDDGSGTISGQPGDPPPHVLDANTSITGIEVGVGSGWGGTFTGFVDNVLISFGSDSVSANFEPPLQCTTICYADSANGSDSNGGTSPSDAKKTIQAAVNQVTAGGRVIVAAGTYTENVVVPKAVSLEGAQKGVLAKGRPGAQSIIKPPVLPAKEAIELQADNISIDGFKFDMSGVNTSWTILALPQGANDRFQKIAIRNNEFIGNPGTGLAESNPGGAYLTRQDDLVIEGNYFNDLGNHAVFLAAYGDPNGVASNRATYRNNDSYSNYNSNISTQEGKHFDVTITNNRAVEDDMILFNINGGSVKNNTLTGATNQPARAWFGGGNHDVVVDGNTFIDMPTQAVLVYDPGFGYGGNSNFTVTNNTIKGNVGVRTLERALIDLRDVTGTVLVDGNIVSLNGTLAQAANAVYGVALRGTIDSATVSNNELDGGNVDGDATVASSGIWLRDTLQASAKVTIKNNKIAGFINAIAAEALASGVNVNATLNSLLASGSGLTNASTAVTIGAEQNWWGSATGPTNASNPGGTGSAVVGNADFTPWLCDGTDTQPSTVGFQPNITSCGPATKLAFSTQPGNAHVNQPLNPQPVVQVVDDYGNVVTSFNGSVSVAIGTNPGGGTLGGTTTVNAVNGVATFTNLSIDKPGVGYTLVASASGLTSATSNPFTISVTPPAGPAPAKPGLVYAIDDSPNGGRAQLFTFNPSTGQATPLAPPTQLDLEDVAIQPSTGALYASSDSDVPGTADDGALYRVDGVTGATTRICKTTYSSIVNLKFRASDGTLWGWAEGKGLVQFTLNNGQPTCATTLVFKSSSQYEGMAWAPDGKLYLAYDKTLSVYTPATGKLTKYATNLPSGTVSLDIRPDGKLVGGNKKTPLKYFVYNISTKKVESTVTVTGQGSFKPKNIEGLALAPAAT